MFFTLSDEFISNNMDLLLCQYGQSYNPLKFDEYFTPETFTVEDKRQNKKSLFFSDISFEQWIKNMLAEQISASGKINTAEEKEKALEACFANFIKLLNYIRGKHQIYNQEAVDVLRRISYYTLYGNLSGTIDTAKDFNSLAHSIMPHVINTLRNENIDLQTLLRLSIVSGLSGLDLKGATAAASSHSNDGIAMRHLLFEADKKKCAEIYLEDLEKELKTRSFPIFHYQPFADTVTTGENRLAVWFTDDIIESYFDLLFIERFLDEYKGFGVRVSLIAKNGKYGNDASYDDIVMMCKSTFPKLLENSRFKIVKNGPLMAAMNIDKFSPDMIDECLSADALLLKGCRISEMLNGAISKPVFSAYSVVRKISEALTGFSSDSNTSLFYFLNKGEYAFWGVTDEVAINQGRIISTVKEHFTEYGDDKDAAKKRAETLEEISRKYRGNLRPLKNEIEKLKKTL